MDNTLCSGNGDALRAFCARYANVIGPAPGRPSVEPCIDADGNAIPAQPAAGDPGLFYACVRCDEELVLPQGIESCATDLAQAVVGVWA